MSDAVPTTIRFQDTRNSSQRPLSDPIMSHAETQTIEATRSKKSVKPSSYTVTELDSPVWRSLDCSLYYVSFTICFSFPFNLLGGSVKVRIRLAWCFGVKLFAFRDTFLVSVSPSAISVPLFALVGTDIYARYIPSIHYDLLVTLDTTVSFSWDMWMEKKNYIVPRLWQSNGWTSFQCDRW
jgi:hypothetical protein